MDWYIDTVFVYYKYHSNNCIYMNMIISVLIIALVQVASYIKLFE